MIKSALVEVLTHTHTHTNRPTSFQDMGPTQSLLCIVLETQPLVFASLTSDMRQIVVRVCQHLASPVQCKQPKVIMQTVVSDHTAAWRLAVCLSDTLVQSALAL